MIDVNHVMITGTIAEPRLTYLDSGKPELRLSVTVEQDGGFRLYVQVYCYGARAEPLAETLEVGDRVLIDGKLSWRSTTKAGVKESKMVVTCYGVEVLTPAGVPQDAGTEPVEGGSQGDGEIGNPEPAQAASIVDTPPKKQSVRIRERPYPKAALSGGFD